MLKISLEGQIEELERTFEAAHQAYLQNTGARATAFQSLTTNDAAAARVIEQRMMKLVQMQVLSPIPAHTQVCCPQLLHDTLKTVDNNDSHLQMFPRGCLARLLLGVCTC